MSSWFDLLFVSVGEKFEKGRERKGRCQPYGNKMLIQTIKVYHSSCDQLICIFPGNKGLRDTFLWKPFATGVNLLHISRTPFPRNTSRWTASGYLLYFSAYSLLKCYAPNRHTKRKNLFSCDCTKNKSKWGNEYVTSKWQINNENCLTTKMRCSERNIKRKLGPKSF